MKEQRRKHKIIIECDKDHDRDTSLKEQILWEHRKGAEIEKVSN